MKRILIVILMSVTNIPIWCSQFPPASFRMGLYTLVNRQDYYDKEVDRWVSRWFNDSITLYSDFRFVYKSKSYYGTIEYSYGHWAYKNNAFILNSVKQEEDTLQLQLNWGKSMYGSSTSPFPAFEFIEMNRILHNINNYGVSFKKSRHRKVMSYDLEQEANFDDFLYRFIHDIRFQNMVIKKSLFDDDIIIIELPDNEKSDVLCIEPNILNEKTINKRYKSIISSPYAFERFPKGYTIKTEMNILGIDCIFLINNLPFFTITFSKEYDTWLIESISILEEGKIIFNL